jgi:hypothetical protein
LIQSPGLVLDVNLANVSSVALDVLQAETTSPTLARTNAPTRPFNVMMRMRQSSRCWNPTDYEEASPENWPNLWD